MRPRAPIDEYRNLWLRAQLATERSCLRVSPEERAFYDALAKNNSAVEIMSNDELRVIAAELVGTIRKNSGTDWWRREPHFAADAREDQGSGSEGK
ncbi:type I restriction enzyme endonuclease domain-containing protein [Ruegeria sp. Ofav3-42]|uniref:type I restriction enzyme endonuclease domain-containing protein n=1 Tax=Ruegeria sp. Ofav3-42 TaxID=2917759 RepID=UPI00351D7088